MSTFKFRNECYRKSRSKNGFIYFSCSFPELWSFSQLRKYIFRQFCADLSKKSIKAIYLHISERSCFALSKNGIFYYVVRYDLLFQRYQALKSKNFVIRTLRCIYVNCFNRLSFLAQVSTKFQKCTFLDNLRTITQEGNM